MMQLLRLQSAFSAGRAVLRHYRKRMIVLAAIASLVAPIQLHECAWAQQLSVNPSALSYSESSIALPGVVGSGLAPSIEVPGIKTKKAGDFSLPDMMVQAPVPGHAADANVFSPVVMTKKPDKIDGSADVEPNTSTRGWGNIVWPQDEDAREWLLALGQEWRERASIVAAWKSYRDLSRYNREVYAYYQGLAAQYVEFQAGPDDETLKPFFDYSRFAAYEDKKNSSEISRFVEESGGKIVVTAVNNTPLELCVSYLAPSSKNIADRVSIADPVYLRPNGAPTTFVLETLPGVLTAEDSRLVFGIGNCADTERAHEQFRLVGFKLGPPSATPEELQEEESTQDDSGGGCPPGTHMEPVSYRQSSYEKGWNPSTGLVWNERDNAWSAKARPFMCVPNHRWDVLTQNGVKDVCEYWFGDRAAVTRHNSEEHPSGIEWEAQPYDIFDVQNSLVASVKNLNVCKCKEGWSPRGATAAEVCRPACLNVPNAELAHRGGTNSEPVCRCKAGYYFSSSGGCVPVTHPTPCPKDVT